MRLVYVPAFGSFLWHINVGKCTNCMDPMGYIYIHFIGRNSGHLVVISWVTFFHMKILPENGALAKGMNFRLWKPSIF